MRIQIAVLGLLASTVSSGVAASDLVADAGASVAARHGKAVLLGSAWGGEAPYRFQWSFDGAPLFNPDNAGVGVDTRGLAPGAYTATLSITDAAGTSSTDAVRFLVLEGDNDGVAGNNGFINAVAGESGQGLTDPQVGDLLPQALTGGTYAFAPDVEQRLIGTVEGGTPPYAAGWDLNLDGLIDLEGLEVTAELPRGHHLVRLVVTDGEGFKTQQMTSVYVGSEAEIAAITVPLTLIGVSDSGINPYHAEFSAAAYPDPRVLELTRNFTRHPCEYIAGYPCSARPLPITQDQGYYPEQDLWIFNREIIESSPDNTGIFIEPLFRHGLVVPFELYWIPGTKIIGAFSAGGFGGGATGSPDVDLILDNNGHGTGSASVSAGNRYGYCPTCLMVAVEGLRDDIVYGFPFAELTSHSHGYVGGAPIGLIGVVDFFDLLGFKPDDSKAAADRGVTILFSSGNGVGNAFDVPNNTFVSDQTGPSWTINVGALRRDTSGAIVGDGTPAHISSWGDGWLPSACRTGIDGTCGFSGTSAASPYTAGVFGHVLREIRAVLGDPHTGVREGQVIAEGRSIPGSPYLADGKLTARELRAAVLKAATPLDAAFSPFVYPVNFPADNRAALEGYGAATPNTAARAIAILLGEAAMPDRADVDALFADFCETSDALYGGYDRNGNGSEDSCAEDVALHPDFAGTAAPTLAPPFRPFEASRGAATTSTVLDAPVNYHLHRADTSEPYRSAATCGTPQTATENDHEKTLSRDPTRGGLEPCFDSRITGTVAGFRPKGIYAASDVLEGDLPAGSAVDFEVFLQSFNPGPIVAFRFILTAGERVIGESAQLVGAATPLTWARFASSFTTTLPALAGERIGVHFMQTGAAEYAYGYTGDHASRFTLNPAPADTHHAFGAVIDTTDAERDGLSVSGRVAIPDRGADAVLGGAGAQPMSVQVQVASDADFADAVWAEVDARAGTWKAWLPGSGDAIHARVWRNGWASATTSKLDSGPRSDAGLAGSGLGGRDEGLVGSGAAGLGLLAGLTFLLGLRRRRLTQRGF